MPVPVRVVPLLLLFALSCRPAPSAADRLWAAMQPLCGQAFAGRVIEGTESADEAMRQARLVMHVRSCAADEIRIPFHVGENRSRTWVLTRTTDGVRLKHDHRHEDGSPDAVTEYGGDTRADAGDLSFDFHADAHTAAIVPAAAANIWTIAVEPGRTFTYALRRENSGRRFRAEFGLTNAVETPPAPW